MKDLVSNVSNALGGNKSGRDNKWGLAQAASTRVRVSFHSDEGFDGVIDSNPDLAKNQPFKIIGFTTSKRFGSEPGTFTITAKSHTGADLLRLWRDPEDVWVLISVLKNGTPNDVMFGLINTITETLDRGEGGTRSLTYQINGQCFQKIFMKTQTFINIHEHSGDLPAITIYDAMRAGIFGSPNTIVKTIINSWLGNDGVADKQWRMPKSLGGRFFFDALELVFDEQLRGKLYEPALLSPMTYQGQALWSLMEEYCNGLFNELYTQLDWQFNGVQTAVRPQLVLRERPFPIKESRMRWESVPTHYMQVSDIHRRQISRGAPESRFNYWLIDGKGILGNGLATLKMIQDAAEKGKGVPGSAPIYDIESIRTHGLRRWQNGTRYLPFREDMDLLLHSTKWLQILHDWYSVSPYELTGTITTNQLYPFLHIGHRLVEPRRDGSEITYYIEGVTQSWNYPGPGSTMVNLTRGEYADEDLLDVVYERLLGEGLDSAIEAAVGLVQSMKLPGQAVPTGSGPQLDRMVGQADTPERRYLKQRTNYQSDTSVKRGELSYEQDKVARTQPGDLPDKQVPAYATALQRPVQKRKKVGVLTQEELENGTRLPVDELRENRIERTRYSEDDLAGEVIPRSNLTGGRKR